MVEELLGVVLELVAEEPESIPCVSQVTWVRVANREFVMNVYSFCICKFTPPEILLLHKTILLIRLLLQINFPFDIAERDDI